MGAAQPKSAPVIPSNTAKAAEEFSKVKPALAQLLESFKGQVVVAGGEGYEDARGRPFAFSDAGWPCAIFFPKSTEEVATLVKGLSAARATLDQNNVKVAIAAGCHGNMSMASNAVVVDLKQMKKCTFSAADHTVSVQGGAKLQDVTDALTGTGYGISTGTHGDTGVAGLTLMGGIGYISARVGMACDNVIKVTIVLASGEVVVATDDNEYKDLMRALRGGGGNFGIVTEFVFQCHDVKSALGGVIISVVGKSERRFKSVLEDWGRLVAETMEVHQNAQLVLPIGAPVIINRVTSVGPANPASAAQVKLFTDMKKLKGPLFNIGKFKAMDFHREMMHLLEKDARRGFATGSAFCMPKMSPKLVDILYTYVHKDKAPGGVIQIAPMTGKINTGVEGRPHCVGHREMGLWIIIIAAWNRPEQEPLAHAWKTRFMDALRAEGGNSTAHALDGAATNNDAYIGDNKAFLKSAKVKYDPDNFFRMNVNIEPEVSIQSA